MKYKVGDEVFIKAEITDVHVMCERPYFVVPNVYSKGWVSEKEIVSGKTYEQGLADAWELAKNIVLSASRGGLDGDVIVEIFGENCLYAHEIMTRYTAEEALAKIEAYEREKEIKETDVVEYLCEKWIVAEVRDSEYRLWNGKKIECADKGKVKKIGNAESIEPLVDLLRQIGG